MELTEREHEIAELVTRGYSEKEIADKLYVSPATIHNHTYNIRKKTGARSAVDIAREFILSLPDPKQFFLATSFLMIQLYAIENCPDIDFRRPPATRITRVKTRKD